MSEMPPDQRRRAKEVLCHVVTPVGMLGYGFEHSELIRGLELARQSDPRAPTAIILDSGSTDSGPAKLALGSMTCPRAAYVRDLRACLLAVREHGTPLLLSSAGGDGADAHVDLFAEIVEELLADIGGVRLKVLSVYSNLAADLVTDRLASGRIAGCGPCVPALTESAVRETATIVGQMGPEPFVQAMAAHPDFDVVLGGRAYDPSPFVAFAAFCAFRRGAAAAAPDVLALGPLVLGGFTHMGKIMECGGLCATPKSRGSMATVYTDGSFDIRPLEEGAACLPLTVAAHTLYEKSRPDRLAGPGGELDLTTAAYEALPDGVSVHVRGATFAPSAPYTVKLEGARTVGFRSAFMGSFSDPILLAQLPDYLARVRAFVAQQHRELAADAWQLEFHVYDGKDHDLVADGAPPPPGVVFIVGEALAATQDLAASIASAARIGCVHGPYKNQKANSGNFGMGIGGRGEIEMGPCAEFSLYHVMDLAPGEEGAYEVPDDGPRRTRSSVVQAAPAAAASAPTASPPLFRWRASWAGVGRRLSELAAGPDKPNGAAPARSVAAGAKGADGTNGPHTPGGSRGPVGNAGTATAAALSPASSKTTTTLGSLARILRSKNAGPYEITLDVLFDDPAVYEKVKASGALTPARVAALYGITADQLVYCGFFDPALAFKATLPRMRDGRVVASGGFMENDVHGSQKYKPLMNIELAW